LYIGNLLYRCGLLATLNLLSIGRRRQPVCCTYRDADR